MVEITSKSKFEWNGPRLPCKVENGVPIIQWLDTPLALRLRAMFPVGQRTAWQLEPAVLATGIRQARLLELYYGKAPTAEEEAALNKALDAL